MLERWGSVVAARRRFILVAAMLLALVGVWWGTGVFTRLVTGGFEDPGSSSAQANAQISRSLGGQSPDVIALYSSPTATAQSPGFRDGVEAEAQRLRAQPGVASVASAYDGVPGLVSRDGHATYLVIRLTALDDSGKQAGYNAIKPQLTVPGLDTQVGGTVAVNVRMDDLTKSDVTRGEMIAMPLVLLLLIVIFGGVVAASLPVLIGGLAILGAFTVVRAISMATDVSTFAVNAITLLGLGMAIDYSLLLINRFRQELRSAPSTKHAVARTLATAGRTILVSGLLVILSLASLLIFPEVFLKSMALGGMAAILVAMISALTVLPAILAMLGPRVNALRVRNPWRRTSATAVSPAADAATGAWARLARSVMRRPVFYALAVVVILAVLASPLLHLRFGSVDERVLPAGDQARTVAERVATDFNGTVSSPILVLLKDASPAQVNDVRRRISELPAVTGAQVSAQRGDATLISASYTGGFAGTKALGAVREVRALPAPPGTQLLVGGDSASIQDEMNSLSNGLPWMLAIMAAVTFGVLLLAFGSVLLPLKAVVTNVASVAATFGALVWIFQDGHLSGLLGFTATGYLEPTVLILVLAELFGLATDYEVFLLSRVREQWDATGDNTTAVATGLQRTGRIITAAAALLIVVTAGFATGQIVLTKLIGIGMSLGIFLDATLIRVLLGPATMRLLGRWNWWAPGPLGRLHRRVRLEQDAAQPGPVQVLTSEGST
ncbi:MAG TPA: MMPL family transporter [Trebonia sp.]|nr:MMPL family transporter [Trebonia sp.]